MRTQDILARACVVGTLAMAPAVMAQQAEGEIRLGDGAVQVDRAQQGVMTAVNFPAGIRVHPDADVADARDDIREVLAEVVEAALTTGGFDDLVERLVDQDRNRIGDLDDSSQQALDRLVQTFNENWKAKYGDDFDINDDQFLGASLAVTVGEVQDSSLAMRSWPISPTGQADRDDMAREAAAAVPADENALHQANLEEGRNVAIAALGMKDGKALHVSLISEAGGWKIDLPNNVTRDDLHKRLSAALQDLNSKRDQWPADATQAYNEIGQKLLSALYDTKASADDREAQPAGGIQRDGNGM